MPGVRSSILMLARVFSKKWRRMEMGGWRILRGVAIGLVDRGLGGKGAVGIGIRLEIRLAELISSGVEVFDTRCQMYSYLICAINVGACTLRHTAAGVTSYTG